MKPKCLSNTPGNQTLYFSAAGYLYPCCWMEQRKAEDYMREQGLLDEKLKLSNVDSVEQILESKPWKQFIDTLQNNPECACDRCKEMCGE